MVLLDHIGQETKPSDEDKATKWENKQDQARGLIGMSLLKIFDFISLKLTPLKKP